MESKKLWLGLLFSVMLVVSMQAQQISPADDATRKLAVDIFKQLIEINTTDSVGSVTAASEAMAKRFRDAGFPDRDIQVLGPSSNDRKKNVVVRLHGSGKHKPVLLIGNAAGRAQRLDAPENGGGCFAGNGLVGDGFEKNLVSRLRVGDVNLKGRGLGDEAFQAFIAFR